MESAGSPPTFRRKLETFWPKFRKTIYFRLLILLLVSALSALLVVSAVLACLTLILIPLLILLIPLWFGERSVKRHAINGLIVLLLASLLYAAIVTPQVYNVPPRDLSANANPSTGLPAAAQLQEGRVTPIQGTPATAFNFTINMTSTDPRARSFSVVVVVASYPDLVGSVSFYNMSIDRARSPVVNYSKGVFYYFTIELTADVHQFEFLAVTGNATNPQASDLLVGTGAGFGPFVTDFGAYFWFFLTHGFFEFAFLVFGFFLILLIYWWTRRARQIRGVQERKAETKRAEGGGEFTCTNCGADVSEADTKCPKCGAVFESEAAGEAAKPIEPK